MGVFLLGDFYFHPKDLGGSARLHLTFVQQIIYFVKYVVKKKIAVCFLELYPQGGQSLVLTHK